MSTNSALTPAAHLWGKRPGARGDAQETFKSWLHHWDIQTLLLSAELSHSKANKVKLFLPRHKLQLFAGRARSPLRQFALDTELITLVG